MPKIRLLDRTGDHLCDWAIRSKPGSNPVPFLWPHMVVWPGAVSEPDRFFALDPNTLPGKPRPALQAGQHEPEIIPTYHECDEALEIGRLY